MPSSHAYYTDNAASFFSSTVGVDMSPLWERFLTLVPAGGHILDAGCGSGRDAHHFLGQGYQVSAFDACDALAKMAAEHTGIDVQVRTFQTVSELERYDGIWACASLLHVPRAEMADALERCWKALKPGGVFYMSFKLGTGERHDNGRDFTDATEDEVRTWCAGFPELQGIQCWITADQRPGRSEQWLNVLVTRSLRQDRRLITGDADPFLPHLCSSLRFPRQTGHPFHGKLDTDSRPNWTAVPAQTGH
jgi:SAM-dependent methyltransferase